MEEAKAEEIRKKVRSALPDMTGQMEVSLDYDVIAGELTDVLKTEHLALEKQAQKCKDAYDAKEEEEERFHKRRIFGIKIKKSERVHHDKVMSLLEDDLNKSIDVFEPNLKRFKELIWEAFPGIDRNSLMVIRKGMKVGHSTLSRQTVEIYRILG